MPAFAGLMVTKSAVVLVVLAGLVLLVPGLGSGMVPSAHAQSETVKIAPSYILEQGTYYWVAQYVGHGVYTYSTAVYLPGADSAWCTNWEYGFAIVIQMACQWVGPNLWIEVGCVGLCLGTVQVNILYDD